jgi:hypothetical protein
VVLLSLSAAFTGAYAAVPVENILCAERLANGNTLICDGGICGSARSNAKVYEVDSVGRLAWAYLRSDIPWAHTARRLPNGNTLITATEANRVIEVTPDCNTAWHMDGLAYPNEAYRLAGGNTLITERDNDRVIEVDPAGRIVWSYSDLVRPHGAERLTNGNTLICDSDNNRVIEVDAAGMVVWSYSTGLEWPRSAQRLANGNTLISDSRHRRILEVDRAGAVRWSFSAGLIQPLETVRLPNGNTLISDNQRVLEVTLDGITVWQYPPIDGTVDSLWVVNPASGCSLSVHIHRPMTSGPNTRVPAVILVPDSSAPGSDFDVTGRAAAIASDGLAVLHFDPDGRGDSRHGTEDYDGFIQQDGLAACLRLLASQPFVDPANVGIYSRGYGIVMATGMLARLELPRVKFLLDFEGPSDRFQCAASAGGYVPVPTDSGLFWVEREAGRFLKNVRAAYLRVQTDQDHTGRMPDNEHAIALVDSATSTAHGGSGVSVWTRVNDSAMNPADTVFTLEWPPEWLSEDEEGQLACRELLYLYELTGKSFIGVDEQRAVPSTPMLGLAPNPTHSFVTARFPHQAAATAEMTVYDAAGRHVRTIEGSTGTLTWNLADEGGRRVRSGVYVVRYSVGTLRVSAKLIVD